jgi:predicted secreted protein
MNKKVYAIPLISFLLFCGCAGISKTAKIEMRGNPSVGDSYECTVAPEGIVREVSHKYKSDAKPLVVGAGGTFMWTFEAIAAGEAEIVVYNRFRGGKPEKAVTYKAVVDSGNNLTLTEWRRHRLPDTVKRAVRDAPEDALIGVGTAKLDTPRQSHAAAQTGAREVISRQMISMVQDMIPDYLAREDVGLAPVESFMENITAALSADELAGARILVADTDDDNAFWVVMMLSKAEAAQKINQAVAAAKLAVPAMASFNADRIDAAFEKIYNQEVQVKEQ